MFRFTSNLSRRLFSTTVTSVTPANPLTPIQSPLISQQLPTCALDTSNLANFDLASSQPTLSVWEKLSHISPPNIYHGVDEFSRELLFTLANDYHLGLPMSVVAISLALRFAFFYSNIKGQIGALKMKEIKPYMDRFQEKMKIAQMTRNTAMLKAARAELRAVQRQKGIDNYYAFVNLAQIPLLITWFLSLRYVAALPEVYPSVTQGMLWISDLSTYDPYFILPIISAILSSYSIVISPGLKNANVLPIMQPFVKYLRYLPFLSLPITGFFPAILNLYWCTLSVSQALLMGAMNSKTIMNILDKSTKKAEPQSQIKQALFVEQKPKTINLESATKLSNEEKEQKISSQKIETIQILKKKPKKIKKQQ